MISDHGFLSLLGLTDLSFFLMNFWNLRLRMR